MAPPTKKRGISRGISFSTTKITLKIPTFSLLWHCGRGYPNLCDCANQKNRPFGLLSRHHRLRLKHAEGMSLRYGVICLGIHLNFWCDLVFLSICNYL